MSDITQEKGWFDQPKQRIYATLSGDDSDERACEAIPDSQCSAVPRNYLANVANGACTKLAEQLASPGLVLPWLMAALGAPAAFVGFLAPLKQVGSLLPQLAVSGQIRRLARRKWAWVGAGSAQALALLAMIPVALLATPALAGLLILVLLAVFSAASGVGSVAFQDVTGKTIPKGRRGHMLANRAAIGGALTLAAGVVLRFVLGEGAGLDPYLWLIGVAAALWAAGALLFSGIEETPGATEGGRTPVQELRAGAARVRRQAGYRRYLLARAALTSVEIAMPIYAYAAYGVAEGVVATLGVFVVAVGIANVVSSPLWGALSDRSARTVMAAGGLTGAAAGALALILVLIDPPASWSWLYAGVFFVLGLAEAGVRLGRKTYLVDGSPKDERPLYVAFANTTIGLVALAMGLIGVVAQIGGIILAIAVLIGLALAGSIAAMVLPEAKDMVRDGSAVDDGGE